MRSLPSHLLPVLGFVALVLVAAGGALEGRLFVDQVAARRALAPALRGASAEPEVGAARALANRGRLREASRHLQRGADARPSAEGHALAALAARAMGRTEDAARYATLAARLAPGEAAPAAEAERLLDLALLGRIRPLSRLVLVLGAAYLLARGIGARRRRIRRRRLAAWLRDVKGRLEVRTDGRTTAAGHPALVASDEALTLDLFLRRHGPPRPLPRPGPTLSVVLSHAGSSRSIRLTPRRDVHDDAVRVKVRRETLQRLLARPGHWRIQARLDGRLVAEAPLDVAERARLLATA